MVVVNEPLLTYDHGQTAIVVLSYISTGWSFLLWGSSHFYYQCGWSGDIKDESENVFGMTAKGYALFLYVSMWGPVLYFVALR